ncbi:MAG: FAD binding domain-containing protein [Gemmatimonadaceae bacterium]
MRTAVRSLQLHSPRTLGSALKLLRDEPELVPLAGCTDLFVFLNAGTLPARRFLDLARLGSLRRIGESADMLSIGAMATYTQMIRSRVVRRRLPMLVAASREVGGPQIQARGTLGGNVANASPAGDTLPVLAAADAVVVLASAEGVRRVPFNAFYTGYRQSVRRPDELIVAVEFPPLDGVQWFRKVGTRAAQAISKIVMAGVRSAVPRVAIGSVAPTVLRLTRTETALRSGAGLPEAQRVMAEEIHPIDDIRSTAEYRTRVSQNLLARFWDDTRPGA